MSKKLNSFILPDDIIKKMNNKIRESQLKMVETGFSLCKEKDKDILKFGNECEGDRCRIKKPSQMCAEKKDEYQGLYHTHTIGTTRPSIADLYLMYEDGLGCIGSVKENRIKCFVRKSPDVDIDTIRKLESAYVFVKNLQYELPKEDFDKLHSAAIKHITNESFNVVDVK